MSSLEGSSAETIVEQIQHAEYQPSIQSMDYKGDLFLKPRCHYVNRTMNLRAYFDKNGMELIPRIIDDACPWSIIFSSISISYGSVDSELKDMPVPEIKDGTIQYQTDKFIITYENSEEGMFQKIVVNGDNRESGDIIVTQQITVQNKLKTINSDSSIIVITDNSDIRFGLVNITDSNGRILNSVLSHNNSGQFTIQVTDDNTKYPICIIKKISSNYPQNEESTTTSLDDINDDQRGWDWYDEGDQQQAYFGFSVSTAGDVNGDGYSDIIVGAYKYDNGQTDEGKVYVYHGSSSGLPDNANWSVESNNQNSQFGFSVSTAGDVNGDGYSDIIIGSPWYTNDQTKEGKIFVYHGSSNGISGDPWTRESDQAYADFGDEVQTAGDVNGDGYSDIIVGSPSWDGGQTDEGKVWVYHGSSTGLPSSGVNWTKEINQQDANLGIDGSVATAGDVNGDGYSDVVIGARYWTDNFPCEGGAWLYRGSSSGLESNYYWHRQGNEVGAQFGKAVSSAGDVNGDGYSDVIVGIPYMDDGENNEGGVCVYQGGPSGPGNPVITLTSNHANALFGWSIYQSGDVNGDGFSDILIGARDWSNGQNDEGKAFLYYGSSNGITSTPNWAEESNQAYACFGYCVNTAGDVNGDGYSDWIIGSPYYDNDQTDEGRAFVYYGAPQGLGSNGNPDNADWQRSPGQNNAEYGRSVSFAGDINGDGYSDVIVGAPLFDHGQSSEGGVWVYEGSSSGLASPSWFAESDQAYAYFGYCVSTAGDVNGDGYSDIVIGAETYDNGQTDEGKVFVWHGSSSGLGSNGNPTNADWNAESNQAYAWFGRAVSTAGDVNGDGYSDVIVGAETWDGGYTNEGKVYVYYGSSNGLASSWTSEPTNQQNAYFGNSVSSAGDVNRDGYSDIIIGAYGYDNGQTDEGKVYVYHGSGLGLQASPNWTKEVNQTNANFGQSVSTAGDVNGDGYSDVIIGADMYDYSQTNDGCAWVYNGSSSGLPTDPSWTRSCLQADARFGFAVSTAGDINGDGYSDVIVGAHVYDNSQTDEGGVWAYQGSSSGLGNPTWFGESNQADAKFGVSISTAGDVNGDGYSDVIIGAYRYDTEYSYDGRAFLWHGNENDGLHFLPRQLRSSIPIQILNSSYGGGVTLSLLGRTPAGRGKVKLQWEMKLLSQNMNGSNLGLSSSWYNTGTSGVTINEAIGGLTNNAPHHWRVRLKYSPLNYIGSVYSPWFSIGPNSWNEKDFRTATPEFGPQSNTEQFTQILFHVFPTVSRNTFRIKYDMSSLTNIIQTKPLTVKVYDSAGRLVKTVFWGNMEPGLYETSWNGYDDMGRKAPAGIYFIKIDCDIYQNCEKVTLIR